LPLFSGGGSPVVITVKVKNTGKGPVSGLRINVDIADPTGKNVKEGVFEENMSLAVGEEKTIAKEYWLIPRYWWTTPIGSLLSGKYTITASVQGPGLSYVEKKTTFVIALYELFVEIDYLAGAEPSLEALNYIHQYFLKKDIYVDFKVDDIIYGAPEVLTDEDFWRIEQQYNDDGDDKSSLNWLGERIGIMTSKYKWVLYGFRSASESLGRCKINDCDETSGNYIFISTKAIEDVWNMAQGKGYFGISKLNVEIKALMHELGHAIGITKFKKIGPVCLPLEDYDYFPTFCVMHSPNADNLSGIIGYSPTAWELADLVYYKIK